jgi:uncharacterized protein YndB with AHSA1/START domain
MTEATLLRAGSRPVLRFERHLPRPPDAVWRAVTDPAEMKAWFPTRIEIDGWAVGAELIHHFDDHEIDPLPGIVTVWDPPNRVCFTWGADTIGFELNEAADGGTNFVLTEGAQRKCRSAQRGRMGDLPRPAGAWRRGRAVESPLRPLRGRLRAHPRPSGRAARRARRPRLAIAVPNSTHPDPLLLPRRRAKRGRST